jgi:hypothetical protein
VKRPHKKIVAWRSAQTRRAAKVKVSLAPVGGEAATMQGLRPNLPEPKGWQNK